MESKIVSTPHADLILALVELDTTIISPATDTPSASSSATPQTPQLRTRKQALNSSDPLYASLRDVNFAIVGTVLNRVARRLSDDYEVLYHYVVS
jgi:vacuolar protein sorting-associated protein 33A